MIYITHNGPLQLCLESKRSQWKYGAVIVDYCYFMLGVNNCVEEVKLIHTGRKRQHGEMINCCHISTTAVQDILLF